MELTIDHIKNLMPQLGFTSILWNPQTIVLNETVSQVHLQYHNEFLYIIPQAVIEGIEILSDTEYLKTDAITTAEPKTLIRPFTGNIRITLPPQTRQVLICLHVIPQLL